MQVKINIFQYVLNSFKINIKLKTIFTNSIFVLNMGKNLIKINIFPLF